MSLSWSNPSAGHRACVFLDAIEVIGWDVRQSFLGARGPDDLHAVSPHVVAKPEMEPQIRL
jgi:hypothetical protein